MAITSIAAALEQAGLTINNIQQLDAAPEMTAELLQKEFDKNVANLVKVFDEIIAPSAASLNDVANTITKIGASDMAASQYSTYVDTGEPPENPEESEYPVDRAFYADTTGAAINDDSGNNITETYATKQELADAIASTSGYNTNQFKTDALSFIYPVGSIFMSVNNINPGSFLGGTWSLWGASRVPMGVANVSANAEETGGANTVSIAHTHSIAAGTSGSTAITAAQMPSHTHTFTGSSATTSSVGHTHTFSVTSGSAGAHTHSFSATTGSAGSHSHSYTKPSYSSVRMGTSTSYVSYSKSTSSSTTGSSGAHTHSVSGTTGSAGAHTHTVSGTSASTAHTHTLTAKGTNSNTGSGNGHTHSIPAMTTASGGSSVSTLQPYITCFMWKRTS